MAQRKFYPAGDDSPLFVVKRDLSGGMNDRQGENVISDTQAINLENVDLVTVGERTVRSGATLIQDLGDTAGTSLFGFEPESGTNTLIANSGQFIKWYSGSGSFTSIASLISIGFNLPMNMVKALEADEGDVVILSNATNNAIRLEPNTPAFQDLGDTNTSPPKTKAMLYYRDRLWALSNQKLMYSGAVPTDYSNTFVRDTNYYALDTGNDRALAGTRDYGIIAFGSKSIWSVNPSIVPDPSTDKADQMLEYGCASGNTVRQVNDDILYLSYDGVRGLFRTLQDKLQAGDSKPLSWNLKDELAEINWAFIEKADAVYWDNKYILSLPTGGSSTNNKVWVYYPALQAWVVITGWNIARFAQVKISNENRLYGIDSVDGKVYRLFYGTSDNGTAIAFNEESRAEDFQKPLQDKYGGEFRVKVRGSNATINVYADPDNKGYVALAGDAIVLPTGGVDFDFDFPFNFGMSEQTGVFHMDNIGKFRSVNFKIYSNTKDAIFTIAESMATTFMEEYLSEEN